MTDARTQRALAFRCTGCGNCCRDTWICVTDAEVRRLVDGSGLPADEIVTFVAHDEITFDARHPWWIRFDVGKRVMVLQHRGDACRFLGENDRCGVYAQRPLLCREHPWSITLSDGGAVEKVRTQRIGECPNAWDGTTSKRELGLLARLRWRESDAYIAKVEAWNRRRGPGRTTAAFLAHLGVAGAWPAAAGA
jgi:Fe-S-cluster containining protein